MLTVSSAMTAFHSRGFNLALSLGQSDVRFFVSVVINFCIKCHFLSFSLMKPFNRTFKRRRRRRKNHKMDTPLEWDRVY